MATNQGQGLAHAEHLFRKRRFSAVIAALEPQIFLYRDNPRFYYLLGASCFYTGDIGGAGSYLKRAAQLEERSEEVELALAAYHLRRRENDDALRIWLDVLDHNTKNRTARRGLALVKKATVHNDPIDEKEILKVMPRLPSNVPRYIITAGVLALLIAAGAFAVPPIVVLLSNQEERSGAEALEISRGDAVVDYTGAARFVLTEEEIRDSLDQIQRYFNDFRDNLARREANRLLLSNASPLVVERVRLLIDYLRTPDFVSFSDNFSYGDVASDPELYRGCYVRWSGAVSNLEMDNHGAEFLFLVGFHEGRVVEGQVPVTIDFPASLQPAMPIELIAQVLVPRDGEDFVLHGSALRLLAPPQDQRNR